MEVYCQCNIKPLITQLEKAEKAAKKTFAEMVDLAYLTFQRLIELTPQSGYSKEETSVAGSWELKFHKRVLFRELEWSVLNDHPVIEYLEYGTRDHWIYPKVAKMLHWVNPDTGEDCFSAGHMVSGIKPVGMIRQTEAELQAELRKLNLKAAMRIRVIGQ